jgi:hypothetical protein
MNASRLKKPTNWVFVAVVAFAGFAIWKTKHESDLASQVSAQNAAFSEITHQLSAWPAGRHYPESLSQLPLTFPDGGDATILRLFEYRSTGTSCTVRTRFRGQEVIWSFP